MGEGVPQLAADAASSVAASSANAMPGSGGIFEMLANSTPLGVAVLLILVLLSVLSWAITIAKIMQFKKAREDSKGFSAVFLETRNLARVDDSARRFSASPLVNVFSSGYREFSKLLQEDRLVRADPEELKSLQLALKRAEAEEGYKLEQGITFLATTASAAPFIGLFGTVWGIMHAFYGLGMAKTSTIQAVAPPISEALVATAVGLGAAIPAAVAFNYFSVSIRRFRESMHRFSSEFMVVAQNYLSSR